MSLEFDDKKTCLVMVSMVDPYLDEGMNDNIF
jgi:hypothetical protein